jgi:Domain of unknown function (DUF4442)
MSESFKTRVTRWMLNLQPTYRGTGGWITYLADDWHEVHIKVGLSWQTRNIMGSIFGGSLYGAVDPVYMIMLSRLLGRDYVVWDEAATIQFKKAARSTLNARFMIDEKELESIRGELAKETALRRVYQIDLADRDGVIHTSVEKTIYIRRRKRSAAPAA